MQRISKESGCQLLADLEENIQIGNFHLFQIIGDYPADVLKAQNGQKANYITNKVIKKCFVDFDIVGRLIGYRGHNLQKLEEETGTKIRISEEIVGSVKREVLIRGTEGNINVAWQKIQNLIENSDYEKVCGETQFIGRLIGSGGKNIKKLERETGARFRFEIREDYNCVFFI